MSRALLFLLSLLVWRAALASGPLPDDREKRIAAVRVSEAPTLDGRLDDPAWNRALPDSRLTQNFPSEGEPPTERTDVYIVYDDRALYVGVRCHDRNPDQIIEQLTRRDRDTSADKVTVDIDSHGDHDAAFHFDVNVSGVLADGLRFNDTDFNPDWDGLWNAVTSRDGGGWSAEIEIPWRTLRFAGGEPRMGVQIRRVLQRRGEVDEWAYIPRTVHAEVARYGQLVGVRGLGPARLIQLVPYVAAGLSYRTGFDPSYDGVTGVTITPNAGADLKIGLNSNLTLDATINPDFGQVEADQAVLNLTTFEVFYPEKRPFYLEGADLLAAPFQRSSQFYSRRIGRSPLLPYLGPGEAFADVPLGGRIWAAVKISGRLLPHLSVAALDTLTAAQEALVLRAGASTPERRLVDPLTNFGVLRLRSEWGQSYVGLMATTVNRFETPNAATPNPAIDLCPDGRNPARGRCTHDAYTAGLDMRLVTADSMWGMVAHGVWSRMENGPSRTLYDGTRIEPGANGYGFGVRGGKLGGEHFLFAARYQGATSTLDLNDAGYLRQQNLHDFAVSMTLRSTKPLGRTLESSWDLFGFGSYSWDGSALLDRGFGTNVWAKFANFWQASADAGYTFSHDDNRETRDGAISERTGGWWGDIWVKSDPRKRLVGEINLHSDRTRHGVGISSDVTLSLRPVPQLEISIIPRAGYRFGDLRYAFRTDLFTDEKNVQTGARYWFGDLESQSFDVTLRGIYTFTPRLTLQTYAQVFVAAGHYSSFVTADAPLLACPAGTNPCPQGRIPLGALTAAPSLGTIEDFREGSINLNVVLRWEYQPGSTLIAVYSRAQSQPYYDPLVAGPGSPAFSAFHGGPSVDSVLVKLSYLWR